MPVDDRDPLCVLCCASSCSIELTHEGCTHGPVIHVPIAMKQSVHARSRCLAVLLAQAFWHSINHGSIHVHRMSRALGPPNVPEDLNAAPHPPQKERV